ncbi:hypothetical protein, partial [uncultured Planktosalinus sp.]|uniref:hypothetical protein n=1 Tax=uncultured Planktosalinus sp. TaxID=1810935 RepID=UPI0030D7A64C
MKIEIKVKKEVEVTHLLIEAKPRYWEDTEVNGISDENGDLIPCRSDDIWSPKINLETGIIIDWPIGTEANIHYKVCDSGEYWILDTNSEKLIKAKGYYVPNFLAIDDNGFGDYII